MTLLCPRGMTHIQKQELQQIRFLTPQETLQTRKITLRVTLNFYFNLRVI